MITGTRVPYRSLEAPQVAYSNNLMDLRFTLRFTARMLVQMLLRINSDPVRYLTLPSLPLR